MSAAPGPDPRTDAIAPRHRAVLVLIWVSAYATYLLAYSSAARLAGALDLATAITIGLTNSLPELLAAPVVLRVAGGSVAPGSRGLGARLAVPILAIAFTAWSILGAAAGYSFHRYWREGTWQFSVDSPNLAWKALLSLLVFGLLAGIGMARTYAREARAASARAERAETLRAEARLAVLRAQLNPHFILNVLHSLVGLAERDPRLTASALERLGTTLRYALRIQSQGIDRVSVREELAFVRDYVELERLRLGDRLAVRFEVDEALLERVVPPFVLQPLVENAIRHGVAARARGGVVDIRIAEDKGALVLTVDDDGATSADPEPGGAGVGLRLLRDRIEALYGDAGRVRTGRSSMDGFRAEIRLPAAPHEDGTRPS